MADKSIIFSAPMIRALLDGRKTQTRRAVKIGDAFAGHKPTDRVVDYHGNGRRGMAFEKPGYSDLILPLTYAPGDRLWVRETWRARLYNQDVPPREIDPITRLHYEADGALPGVDDGTNWDRCRSPIHMPRWASRMTLGVTEVRVQRLQEISEADAVAEGGPPSHPSIDRVSREFGYPDFPRAWFAQTWDTLHGPGAWDRNEWVCALTFTVQRCNIDQMPN